MQLEAALIIAESIKSGPGELQDGAFERPLRLSAEPGDKVRPNCIGNTEGDVENQVDRGKTSLMLWFSQRVYVGICYILPATRGYHINTSGLEYYQSEVQMYSYMDPVG